MIIRASATAIPLADDSVQCVVTKSAYWGLRKYAGEQELVWPNEALDAHVVCEHEWGDEIISNENDSRRDSFEWTTGGNPATKILGTKVSQGNICAHCGAWRGGYGLEPTVEMYVAHTVTILREIRRVLRPDGVIFLNLGDSYASGKGTCFNPGGGQSSLRDMHT